MKVDVERLLQKCAEEGDGLDPLALGVGGAVGATPLLGLIGQKKLQFDPFRDKSIPRMTSYDLSRAAKPGDVLVTSKPGGSGFKILQYPLGSEFYHAQPVVSTRGGHGTTVTAGQLDLPEYRKMKTKALLPYMQDVKAALRADHYRDAILMRPDRALSPAEIEQFKEIATRRATAPYTASKAVRGWIKEVLLPKIKGVTDKAPPGMKMVCSGDVCSTLPAQTMWEVRKQNIHKGKLPYDIMPTDYLREGSGYSPVGAKITSPRLSPKKLRAIQIASRLGLGLGLGAGAYSVAEDPVNLAAPVGALATPYLLSEQILPRAAGEIERLKILRSGKKLSKETRNKRMLRAAMRTEGQIPQISSLLQILGSKNPQHVKLRNRFLTRSLPLTLAGGVGSYLLADKIRDSLVD